MQIDIQKSRVTLLPENNEEKAKLEAIWRILTDCIGESRKLVPIGEYVPIKSNEGASFHIEGMEPQDTSFAEIKIEQDTQVYCKVCNKLMRLKAGEVVPMCCGKMMTIID